jgi:hypothetical protein
MNNTKQILFIAANPINGSITNWKKEYEVLEDVINNSNLKNYYSLSLEADATPDDFIKRLENCPWIIHFSGHGDEKTGEIILQGDDRKSIKVKAINLIENLRYAENLECVVFTSCFSKKLIQETRKIVKYSIGFEGTIQNRYARQFVNDFYKCLAKPDVNTISTAYQRTLAKYNFRQQPIAKPLFECRRLYIMNEIILKKKYELKAQLSAEGQRELDVLELEMQDIQIEIDALHTGSKGLLSRLLAENPFASSVFWFVENRKELVVELAERILRDESDSQ